MTSSSSPSAERLRPIGATLVAWLLLVAGVLVSIAVGGGEIGWSETLRSLGSRVGLPVEPLSALADSVVWQLRAPRALLAAVAGAGLATSGAILQAVTRNALAEPYLLGISSGASTGAVLVMVAGLGAGAVSLAAGALVGGLVAFGLVLVLLGRHASNTGRLVLTGVVVGQLFTAMTSLVLLGWGDADAARGLTYWLTGSLAAARWPAVALCVGVTSIALVAARLIASDLDAFAFGAVASASLGVPVAAVRSVALIATAAVTAVVVSAVGAIGFVGLIVPHAVRALVGPQHRRLLPASAFGGAVFLLLADLVGRIVLAPRELPVGVITALIGVPAFLIILRRKERS
ncbi:FecCD family ABC transporter permease [Propioniferax innocua]|uniref:Iron complex transport system permease protein n=1 Tax=Propioniferax innocua TaxID=1753 RepID=A0A542ZQB2_9ACTN|nr:iron ABC transporter permease [Propioniferax innocua]TQL62542.1 iron complex transport system permease protein [Propioniferax innocua]